MKLSVVIFISHWEIRNLRYDFKRFEGIAKGIVLTAGYKRTLSQKVIWKKQLNKGLAEVVEFAARDFRITTYYLIIDVISAGP